MSKHIKGPWGYWPNCCREGGMVTVTRGGQHIAAPTFFPNDQDVTLANAILLAAAPELLASLGAITARHAPNSDFMGDDEFAEFTRARAVIAKATGGTK